MRSLAANILSCVSIVLAGADGVSAQPQNSDQPQTIHLQPFHGPNVSGLISFGNCQWLFPLDEPNETLTSQPAYGSSKRVYYAARYGDAKDNTYTFVIDEVAGTGTGFNTLYADLNNDNRLDPNSEKFPLTLSGLTIAEQKNVRIMLSVRVGGKTIPYAFNFAAFRYKDLNHPIEKIHATCGESTVMVGEAELEGKRYKVALDDLNCNGVFNDYEQGLFRGDRFLVDLNGNGKFEYISDGIEESFPYAQYTAIGGKWYTIEASADGGTVQIRFARPTFGAVKAVGKVKSAGLSSPRQFQRLDFKNGPVQALTGVYQVRDVRLEITDEQRSTWNTEGGYRQAGPQLAIEPNQEASLGDTLPLAIQVAVLPTAEANTIELEPRIVDRHGGSFSTLRKDNERHQPPARLVIKDSDGKQIADAALEYG
jgi:hypothetical protein